MRRHRLFVPHSSIPALVAGTKTQHRVPVNIGNSTVLGYPSRDYWPNLRFDHAKVRDDNPLMMALSGTHVPGRDFHLGVPWHHPDDPPCPVEKMAIYRVRPIYAIGDEVWVPETWRPWWDEDPPAGQGMYCVVQYCADGGIYKPGTSATIPDIPDECRGHRFADECDQAPNIAWRSPVSMPCWASRLRYTVENVGVEKTDAGWVWVLDLMRIGGGR